MSSKPTALIIKLSSLGDVFCPLPAVHLLKNHLDCHIHWLTQPEYVDVVSCFTDVDRVFAFPRRKFLLKAPAFIRQLREQQYDYVFDMQGLMKSCLSAKLSRHTRLIGPSFHREGTSRLYPETASFAEPGQHAVDMCLDTARYMGIQPGMREFSVKFPPSPVSPQSESCIAMAPCSRWKAKDWPVERFAELAQRVRDELQAEIILVGGPADHAACETIMHAMEGRGIVNACGKTSIPELGGLLSRVKLLVTNDSGPMHIAAAAGTPVVALFGPTDPSRTGPYGARHTVIQLGRASEEKRGGKRAFKSGSPEWMDKIPVDAVFQAVRERLQ